MLASIDKSAEIVEGIELPDAADGLVENWPRICIEHFAGELLIDSSTAIGVARARDEVCTVLTGFSTSMLWLRQSVEHKVGESAAVSSSVEPLVPRSMSEQAVWSAT